LGLGRHAAEAGKDSLETCECHKEEVRKCAVELFGGC
jgi:hypothetical protein